MRQFKIVERNPVIFAGESKCLTNPLDRSLNSQVLLREIATQCLELDSGCDIGGLVVFAPFEPVLLIFSEVDRRGKYASLRNR